MDAKATASAISLLSTLAVELMEDGSTLTTGVAGQEPQALAQTLRQVGADIIALANAIEVLDRRTET